MILAVCIQGGLARLTSSTQRDIQHRCGMLHACHPVHTLVTACKAPRAQATLHCLKMRIHLYVMLSFRILCISLPYQQCNPAYSRIPASALLQCMQWDITTQGSQEHCGQSGMHSCVDITSQRREGSWGVGGGGGWGGGGRHFHRTVSQVPDIPIDGKSLISD